MTAYKTIDFLGETDRINYRYDETTANVSLRWRGPVAFDVQQELNDYYSSGHTEYDAMHNRWSVNWNAYDNVIVPRPDSDRYTVEQFQFDGMDRLVSYENTAPLQLPVVRTVSYQENGNIYSKTGIGLYHYDTDKPHAVTEITGLGNEIAHTGLTTSFNDDGKIDCISLTDDVEARNMYFYYGQGGEKWETFSFATSGSGSFISSKRHVYFGNYERITEGTSVTEQYFLDNDVILIQKDGVLSFYKAFTDAQGSILSVFDEYGNKVFDASYDAWGRQTVTQNDIDLHYGYCGHEMLPFDNLIDMGGRVYDSAIGRFLSCDNYVQEPDNSQNFNRYSYCLNNPLRYTDPTGELFGIDDAIIAFTVFNMASSMMQAAFNGQSIWKAAGISLLGSAASFGIGQLFGATGGFLNEAARAGTHGLATGLTTALSGGNFFTGFVSGASSSGIGSFAQGVHMPTEAMIGCTTVMGGLTSWATGGDFWQGAINGLAIGALNHAQHDIRYTRNANGDIQGEIPEVEIVGHRILKYVSRVPVEKGLEPVYPEFFFISVGRALINGVLKASFSTIHHTGVKSHSSYFNNTKNSWHVEQYKIKPNPKDPFHSFPSGVDAFEKSGVRYYERGGDGKLYEHLRINGSYRDKNGTFEYIKDDNGIITHRFFKKF